VRLPSREQGLRLWRAGRWHAVWLGLALAGGLASATWVQAHGQRAVGPYTLVLGWATEPVIVGERNALTLDVTQAGQPVEGAQATLKAELHYGGRQRLVVFNATPTPGQYHAGLIPTVRGQYAVRIVGVLQGTSIDQRLEPEEVMPATSLHFPEALPDLHEVQTAVNTLSAQVQSARQLTLIGLGCGVAGILLALGMGWQARRTARAAATRTG
jgi:hypothetical protein